MKQTEGDEDHIYKGIVTHRLQHEESLSSYILLMGRRVEDSFTSLRKLLVSGGTEVPRKTFPALSSKLLKTSFLLFLTSSSLELDSLAPVQFEGA